jgi:hypothetical protein
MLLFYKTDKMFNVISTREIAGGVAAWEDQKGVSDVVSYLYYAGGSGG